MSDNPRYMFQDLRKEFDRGPKVDLRDGLLEISGLLTALGMVADMQRSRELGKQRQLFKNLEPRLTDFTRGLINKSLLEAAQNMVQEVNKRADLNWTVLVLEQLTNIAAADDSEQLRERLIKMCAMLMAWVENIDMRKARADETIGQMDLRPSHKGPHMERPDEDDVIGPAK